MKISPSNPDITDVEIKKARKKMSDAGFARLWARAGGRCQFRGCNCKLYEDELTQSNNNHGQIAHIIAFSPKGARGDKKLSELSDGKESNAMLMCHKHHYLIDYAEPEKYTVEILREMKAEHEAKMEYLQGLMYADVSRALVYFAKTSRDFPKIRPDEIRDAILNAGLFPSNESPINLTGGDVSNFDTTESYWKQEEQRLISTFQSLAQPAFGLTSDAVIWSIFAIAPQPLLVKLGAMLGSLQRVRVFQRHRQTESWNWPNIDYNDAAEIIRPESGEGADPALILAISGVAIVDNVKAQYPTFQTWIVKAHTPSYYWCANRDQQQEFKTKVATTLDEIKAYHPGKDINVFMAVPASLAVEFGRIWLPKADAALQMYDINQITKQYTRVLTIEN